MRNLPSSSLSKAAGPAERVSGQPEALKSASLDQTAAKPWAQRLGKQGLHPLTLICTSLSLGFLFELLFAPLASYPIAELSGAAFRGFFFVHQKKPSKHRANPEDTFGAKAAAPPRQAPCKTKGYPGRFWATQGSGKAEVGDVIKALRGSRFEAAGISGFRALGCFEGLGDRVCSRPFDSVFFRPQGTECGDHGDGYQNASTVAIRQHQMIRISRPHTVEPEHHGLKTLEPISCKATQVRPPDDSS